MLFSLVYTSLNTMSLSSEELVELLDFARFTNVGPAFTSMPLDKQGAFMQALEGDEDIVRQLAEKISHAPQHHSFSFCIRQQIDKREFPNWSMGMCDPRSADTLVNRPGYTDFMNQPLTRDAIEHAPLIVNRFFQLFRN